MDIRLNSTFTLFQPGRPTLTPSYFLLHFVDVSTQQQRFSIVQNLGEERGPLLFEVEEKEGADPTLGEVQLYAGNWTLTVYEQTSPTNQNIANAGRSVWSELIGVCEPQDVPAREPYDPCTGCEGGACTEPLQWTLRDTEGNTLDSGEVEDPCGADLEVEAPDARVTRDGSPFGTVPSGGTIDVPSECRPCPLEITFEGIPLTTVADPCDTTSLELGCDTVLPFARVEDGSSVTGNYLLTGSVYKRDVDHQLQYITDRWVLVKPGSDIDAAVGSETFPWEADWSGTGVTVLEGTIAALCDDCEPADLCTLLGEVLPENVITQVYDCLSEAAQDELDVEVEVNGTLYATVPAAGSVDIPVINTATTPIGTVTPGVDVEIADSAISVDSTPELNLPATVALNITLNDGTNPVTPVDVDTSTPGVMSIEIAPCPTPPANVLREYTADDTWSKPSSTFFQGVWVLVAGGGGSGASGDVAATNQTGGTGGSGGALVRRWLPSSSLGSTETITIGLGGASVALGTGNNGGDTSFGTHAIAKGGIGGIFDGANPQPGPAGGDVLACTPIASGMADRGAPGGQAGRTTATTQAGGDGMTQFAGAGGGGGGGYTSGGGASGARGGGIYQNGVLTQGGAGGSSGNNGTSGVDDINLNPFGELVVSTIGFGTAGGGGGGSGASGSTGGNGGDAGRAAGGGGGGSATVNVGSGGAGGDGFCIIYEVYA